MALGHDFIQNGYVLVEQAFSPELAAVCRALLWQASGLDEHDPATWTRPVIRIDGLADSPFIEAANTERLTAAYDELVGVGRWLPRTGLGSFPIRFPSDEEPGDDGWHVDASFADGDSGDIFTWRVNHASRGRALLMLFLFSDVATADAPTRIRVGSHLDVARLLASHGDEGLAMLELSRRAEALTADLEVALATGQAGDVYLCHPFLVHAAQRHRGSTPRFLAQPPLYPADSFQPATGTSPVEVAIRRATTPT